MKSLNTSLLLNQVSKIIKGIADALVKIPPPSERGPSAALFSDLLSRRPGKQRTRPYGFQVSEYATYRDLTIHCVKHAKLTTRLERSASFRGTGR
jgi:hypothetical protein